MHKKLFLGITMGDPYGIGPEIIVKTIAEEKLEDILIIGNYDFLVLARKRFAPKISLNLINDSKGLDLTYPGVPVLDVKTQGLFDNDRLNTKTATAEGGMASVAYIKTAVNLALQNRISGIVTAPLSKEAIHKAGYPYAGHTEFLAYLTNTKKFAMMLAGGPLKVILVTTHCALAKVPQLITKEKIYDLLVLVHEWWTPLFGSSPKLAVAALNPHGGEGGIFGNEEGLFIQPAIEQAKREGIEVEGPYPADTLFHNALNGRFDAVIVMYHDQGLIPLKMLFFGKGVNCTIGLPIIRTSVDHGTAYDIAWKGQADTSSLKEAIRMARDLVARRKDGP